MTQALNDKVRSILDAAGIEYETEEWGAKGGILVKLRSSNKQRRDEAHRRLSDGGIKCRVHGPWTDIVVSSDQGATAES